LFPGIVRDAANCRDSLRMGEVSIRLYGPLSVEVPRQLHASREFTCLPLTQFPRMLGSIEVIPLLVSKGALTKHFPQWTFQAAALDPRDD
jgi:hypothetical protein